MITIQQSENSQNQKDHTDRNFDMRTDLTQTLTLKFISETNQPQQIKIEDLKEYLSLEIPYFDLINHYFNIFTLDWHTRYLISYHNIKKQKNFNEEQLGIEGNGQVFLCKDLGTLELHALKFVKDISFDTMHSILNECINQYHLMSLNKELILNFVNQISIRVVNSKVDFQIPLELAEFSLYDYIQANEISEEIYQQLINILIDFLILLHTNNYAHRDIKPQNILYVKDAGWKLADFGESIYYEVSQGMYNIKGTLAFISQEVRKHQKLNRQIYQDLFKNDVYAAVCTLVMIKNPQFKSKDLQQFMQENQLDTICQMLINITQVEQLNQFKQEKLSGFQYLGKFINRKDELVYYDVKLIIQLQSRYRKTLDSCTIQIIDAELGKLKDNNRKVDYIRVVLQLVQYYPFLIDKFINIIEFDHNDIFKNPQLYFSNTLEHCQYFFGRGLHKKLIELQNQIQNDCLESMIMKLYSLILYGQLELAKHTLNLIANKIYQESSQVNSLFLSFYNQQYYILHDEFPIIKGRTTNDIQSFQIMKELNHFSRKDLNEEDIQYYLNMKSFKPRDSVNLLALLHPLQPKFSRFRNQQIYDHILNHIGCDSKQIQENKQLLSDLLKEHLQFINCNQGDLQLIIQGCVILYQYYDLLYELLDLLVYFYKIQVISRPGIHILKLCVEIQRLIIKYNIEFDYELKNFQKYLIQTDSTCLYEQFLIVLESNICSIQYKLIKIQFKNRVNLKFKLRFSQDLLKILQLIHYQKNNDKKVVQSLNLLSICIQQSKPKIQQRFLQGTIAIFQQLESKEHFIKHFYELRQYKRLRNSFNFQQDLGSSYLNLFLIFARILLKYHSLSKLIKIYPTLKVQLFLQCYDTNSRLFQDYNQHQNAFGIYPRLKIIMPLHNKDLQQMYLSKN